MHYTMSLPLGIAMVLAITAIATHAAGRLPDHRAYGLYALSLAFSTIHCLVYGNFTWACVCATLSAAITARWWQEGGRSDIHPMLQRRKGRQ